MWKYTNKYGNTVSYSCTQKYSPRSKDYLRACKIISEINKLKLIFFNKIKCHLFCNIVKYLLRLGMFVYSNYYLYM